MNKYLGAISYCCFIYILFLATGCQLHATKQAEVAPPVAVRISEAGKAAASPFLTQDQHGNPVLCWVQATDTTGNYLLYYATSADGGQTFGTPKPIPTTKGVYPHDENLSKILYKKNGDIMVMFAVSNPSEENSYAGLVYYTQSFDGGKRWTAPRQLSESGASSIDERYFDMALLPNGDVAAVWLDSRKDIGMGEPVTDNAMQMHGDMGMHMDKEGSSLYYASTSGRGGFSGEKVIDRHLCQCCRTDLYVDEKGQLHVAYRGILNDSIRDMMHLVSTDNGKSFSKPERISLDNWAIDGCPHTGPTMASNSQGMHYAWFTMGGGSGVFYSRQPSGGTFTPRAPVSNVPSAKHPQMTVFGKGKLAIVWDERVPRQGQTNHGVSLQLRSEIGEHLSTSRLTPDSVTAVFPVITPVSESRLLVAYTVKSSEAGEVWCQVVPVKE